VLRASGKILRDNLTPDLMGMDQEAKDKRAKLEEILL